MDLEFHYYITHLLAARAGFSCEDTYIIAYSSQYTDDNYFIFRIGGTDGDKYTNYISQTMNILKPQMELLRIYPLFHFIPGDPMALSARRKDGKMHLLNTTPDSRNVNLIFRAAADTKDLYRLGIACHAYADTYTHQNFVGCFDIFNSSSELIEKAMPHVGHACALYKPDMPGLIWTDSRLLDQLSLVDNKKRILEAAGNLYMKLRYIVNPSIDEKCLDSEITSLLEDLNWAIGMQDENNDNKPRRIERYLSLSRSPEYREIEIADYDPDRWLNDAVNEEVKGIRDRDAGAFSGITLFPDKYTWKDPLGYKESRWYKFQQAVKDHQNTAWNILEQSTFANMSLCNL